MEPCIHCHIVNGDIASLALDALTTLTVCLVISVLYLEYVAYRTHRAIGTHIKVANLMAGKEATMLLGRESLSTAVADVVLDGVCSDKLTLSILALLCAAVGIAVDGMAIEALNFFYIVHLRRCAHGYALRRSCVLVVAVVIV